MEVLAVDAPRELLEQMDLDLLKLGGIDHIKDLFHFAQKHHLLGGVDFRPILEKPEYDLFCEGAILFQKLDDAICKLWMVHGETLDLVERDEQAHQKCLVFLLQRQGKTVDDGSENLQKFSNAVMSFAFVDEVVEYVVDGTSDGCTKIKKFAIYPV